MLPVKAASANPEDFLSLQLKSAEGKGLDAPTLPEQQNQYSTSQPISINWRSPLWALYT
jgi:hypothetical protein